MNKLVVKDGVVFFNLPRDKGCSTLQLVLTLTTDCTGGEREEGKIKREGRKTSRWFQLAAATVQIII
jgi:hypothetical protein